MSKGPYLPSFSLPFSCVRREPQVYQRLIGHERILRALYRQHRKIEQAKSFLRLHVVETEMTDRGLDTAWFWNKMGQLAPSLRLDRDKAEFLAHRLGLEVTISQLV